MGLEKSRQGAAFLSLAFTSKLFCLRTINCIVMKIIVDLYNIT